MTTIAMRNRLLEKKLPLIERCVDHFLRKRPWLRNSHRINRDDFLSIGAIKAANVLDEIDISRINDLDAFLYVCIRRALRHEADGIQILSRSRTQQLYQYRASEDQLQQILHRKPMPNEVAQAMDISEPVAQRLAQDTIHLSGTKSLDAPLSVDSETTLLESYLSPDENSTPDENSVFLRQIVRNTEVWALADLTSSEMKTVKRFYGLENNPCLTTSQIAEEDQVCPRAITSRIVHARNKLFCFLAREGNVRFNLDVPHQLSQKILNTWLKGAECWTKVRGAYTSDWESSDFLAQVAHFYKFEPATLLKPQKGKPANPDIPFARNVLMALLYYVQCLPQSKITELLNTTYYSIHSRIKLMRMRLSAVGIEFPNRDRKYPRRRNPKKILPPGYVIVSTHYGSGNTGFDLLNRDTITVHIDGTPYLWALEKILTASPNLKIIQITPRQEFMLSKRHRRLCKKRRVTLAFELHSVNNRWKVDECRSPYYKQQREFLLNLHGNQRNRFETLLQIGLKAAQVTARYFCLNGEGYLPQRAIAKEFGFRERSQHYISQFVNATLLYLKYSHVSFTPGKNSRRYVKTMRMQVIQAKKREIRVMAEKKEVERRKKIQDKLGIPSLADDYPLDCIPTLQKLLKAQASGKLQQVKENHLGAWRSVVLRFGLDNPRRATYRTYQEVAVKLGGLSRQRAQQLEQRGLKLLGISA